MFDRMDTLKRWLTLQALVTDDAPVQEKIHQMMSEVGLHGYCFVEESTGWTIRPMTGKELSDFKLARVQDGDMLTIQSAPFLSEVVRGPVELFLDRDGQVKILAPSFQRRPGMVILRPLSIRTIHRNGKVVVTFYDERI